MDYNIQSLRLINEIENLVWSEFKKEVKVKNGKKVFGSLLNCPKIYKTNKSFANSPIHLEYIVRQMMLLHYKTLVDLNRGNGVFSIGKDIVTSEIYKSLAKSYWSKPMTGDKV